MKNTFLIILAFSTIGLALSSCDLCIEQRAWFKSNLLKPGYRRVIKAKYVDSLNRDHLSFLADDGLVYIFYNEQAYNAAAPGDTVIKLPNTLKHILKKPNGDTLTFYPICRDVEIRE